MKKVIGGVIGILGTVLIGILLYGCVDKSVRNSKPVSTVMLEEQVKKIISGNNYIIIDVRTKSEYEEGHVVGAIHIPYDEFEEAIDTHPEICEGKDVLIYSGDGSESALACDILIESGHGAADIGAYEAVTLEKE